MNETSKLVQPDQLTRSGNQEPLTGMSSILLAVVLDMLGHVGPEFRSDLCLG